MAANRDPQAGGADDDTDLAAVVDALLAEAAELKRQWTELHRVLSGEAAARKQSASPRREAHASDDADPRRLIALEMLLAGRSREDVEAYLRAEFGPDAGQVVEEIFGAG